MAISGKSCGTRVGLPRSDDAGAVEMAKTSRQQNPATLVTPTVDSAHANLSALAMTAARCVDRNDDWRCRRIARDGPTTSGRSLMSTSRTIGGQTVLVTGANRGIGRALLEEALRRGAARVYAATRRPWTHADVRVTALEMDVTNAAQIGAAVRQIESLD